MIDYHLATIADISDLVTSRLLFLEELLGPPSSESSIALRAAMTEFFRDALREARYVGWFAKHDGEVVGSGGMVIRQRPGNYANPSGRDAYIMNIHTLPGYRRQGIAGSILTRLLESGKERGIHAFELHATSEGEPLYLRTGFSLHPQPTYRMLIEQAQVA